MRRFQFSIRDLLLIIVIAALATGWWFDHRRLSKEQQLTVFYVKHSDPNKDVEVLKQIYRDRQDFHFIASGTEAIMAICPRGSVADIKSIMNEMDLADPSHHR